MLRGITKLLLLLILVLMATGFPIYFDRIDADSFWERASSRIEAPEDLELPGSVNFHHELERQSEESYLLHMRIDNQGEPVSFEEDLVEFSILHGNQRINTLNLNDFNEDLPIGETIGTQESVNFSIELHRTALGYPYESFGLELHPREDLLSMDGEQLELNLTFEENFSYIPAIFTLPRSETALTLYFPTNLEHYSVPITRIIPYTDMQIRATVDGLFEGPHEDLGLTIPEEGIMPPWQNLAFANGLATINLSSDLAAFDEDQTLGQQAYRAYAYSVNATSFTNRVQFTFNHGMREEAFGGISVDDPITLPEGPTLYFGYGSDTDRLLLVPEYLQLDPDFQNNQTYYNEEYELTDPEGFYQLFTFDGNADFYNDQRQPLVNSSVSLNSISIEDTVLEITFDNSFIDELSEDVQHAMFDGLLMSFTSFTNIDSVVFTVDDYEEETLYRYPLGAPIEAPTHLNPEVPVNDS